MAYNLPPTVRRILTTHDENGKAIVWKDEQVKPFDIRSSGGADLSKDGSVKQSGGSAKFAHLFTTDTFPYDNADTRDLALEETGGKLSNEGGIVLRIVDIPPHSDSPFHRTQSLDFGIVMEGECVLVLDDGKEVHMKRGDVAVQRGTIHGWRNYSDSWARIYFSLMASKPLTINGKNFGDAGYDGKAAH